MNQHEMNKRDNVRIVTLIERAERETPFCDCGEPMAATARDGQIWLDCTAHQHPQGGRIRRLIAALASAEHTRRLIVDPV
ncbi:MAG: hypothetical protein WCB51_11060 [Candidatus Dormiibacterota bacterium]